MREELDRPLNWRTLTVAFLIWAAHFALSYAAELILPGNPAVRWIALAAALAAFAVVALCWRRLAPHGSRVVKLALAIASMAIAYQTLPALIG
jgi:hypothetical protein